MYALIELILLICRKELVSSIKRTLSQGTKTATQLQLHNDENELAEEEEMDDGEKAVAKSLQDAYRKYMDEEAIIRLTVTAV